MSPNERANLKIARDLLDKTGGRETALRIIDDLIANSERENARRAAAEEEGR